ncbi:MAG: Flp pilus assembly complex ATPase component TadA [Clostridiales bacterium]|nr:Flp pilus assembly complex ATPase component TadA [Clostridiales bacterium]
MKKEDKNKRTGNAYTYSNDEIRACMSEIRLLIAEEGENISDSEAMQIIEDHVFSLKKSQVCGHKANTELIDRIFLSLRREMDILQPYIDDSSISEIMVNGRSDVFAERHGRMERLPVEFDTVEDLEELIRRIASRVHREINELNPIVDARLSDGSRVNAVYKNIALNGPILTIRKFPDTVMTMDDLISNGTVEEETASFLEKLVKAGYNCFICGGTSSGKTTLLNVLSQSIPPGERLVVIEDSAELQIEQVENIVRLECRNANVQGKGGIDMSQLVKASLRMRPDRIIVGEVRGKEVMDMIQALNTGHSGMSTGHANSIDGMLKRLEAMFLQAADFPVEAIRRQITAGIEIMIHMSRMKDGSRKITEIAELTGMEGGNIKVNMLYSHERGRTENALENREKLELAGMTESSGQNR